MTPKKFGVGLKRREEFNERRLGWRLAWRSTEKEASRLLGLRGQHQYSDQRFNRIRAPWVVFTGVGTEGEEDQMARSSAADERRQISREIIDEKREKYRTKNGSLQNTSTDSNGTTFVILKNHASASIRKEILSPTSNTRRDASRNKFVEKGGVPDIVESFREINRGKNRLRARLGFVTFIRDGLRKEQNLLRVYRPGRKPAWRGEKMELGT